MPVKPVRPIKFLLASHVPYVDEHAVRLVEFMLKDIANSQNGLKKHLLTSDMPFIIEVAVTIQAPDVPPPDDASKYDEKRDADLMDKYDMLEGKGDYAGDY